MVHHILQLRIQNGKNVRGEEHPCSKTIQYLFGSYNTHVRPENKQCKTIHKLTSYYKNYRKRDKFYQINANDQRDTNGISSNNSLAVEQAKSALLELIYIISKYRNIAQDVTHRTGNIYIIKLCLTLIWVRPPPPPPPHVGFPFCPIVYNIIRLLGRVYHFSLLICYPCSSSLRSSKGCNFGILQHSVRFYQKHFCQILYL